MNCYNMQHKFGKPVHRSTQWRRKKAFDCELVPGSKKRGRSSSDEVQTETFILFAGAVIELQNTNGYCDYGEVFNGVAQGVMGFRYSKVPDEIKKRLVESMFPPQLLAVVVSDLIPLNLITRGGRHTSVKKDFRGKVKSLTLGQVLENEDNLASGRPNLQFNPPNSAGDIVTDDLIYETDFAEIDERLGWHEPNETPPSPPVQRLLPLRREKGTPVHRIMFHGGIEISRRMACYWRNDCWSEYNRCRKFIVEKLLKKPAPVAPYRERVVTYGPSFNALNQLYAAERLASKIKTKS